MTLSNLPDIYCLGVESFGACPHDLANPALSFFSIGQLASVIALILAFSQLTRPLIKFRLATRLLPRWIPFAGIVIAILLVFMAAILRMYPHQDLPVIGYPIFWEFIAGALLVWASVMMVYSASTRTTLSSRNATRFFEECRSLIAKGNYDDLRELADEIDQSIPAIVTTCSGYLRRSRERRPGDKEPITPTQFEKVCFTLLDLWSDQQFCKVLVINSPETATKIFLSIREYELLERGAYSLVNELIHQAFINEGSILHREKSYSGLGRSKSFMSAVFSSVSFVSSGYRPLEGWKIYSDSNITKNKIERYGDATKMALDSAIDSKQVDAVALAIKAALQQVNSLTTKAAFALRETSESDLSKSNWAEVISACGDIFEETLGKIISITPDSTFVQQHFDSTAYDQYKDDSIYGVIAYELYEYFEHLSMCLRHDTYLRLNTTSLWSILFGNSDASESARTAIQQRFLVHMKKKVAENLDPEHWYYPLITRLLISLWGLPDAPDGFISPLPDSRRREESDFYVYVFKLIQENYLSIRKRNPEYSQSLLPEDVDFIESPPSLRKSWFRGRTTTLRLIERVN